MNAQLSTSILGKYHPENRRGEGAHRVCCNARAPQQPGDRMRLLVTRPEGDGERTAASLRARGHEVMFAPLLRIEPVAFALPEQSFGAVVLTSAKALLGQRERNRLDRKST